MIVFFLAPLDFSYSLMFNGASNNERFHVREGTFQYPVVSNYIQCVKIALE